MECPCGSGLASRWESDARGLPLCRCCPKCRDERLSAYRPDVLTDSNYWTDEPVDPEE
jgi:hypothetical protein